MVKAKAKRKPSYDPERVMLDTVLTPEARQHGEYRVGPITVVAGEFDGQTKGEMNVVQNDDVDAINRWGKRGDLDPRQLAAVAIYRRAYGMVFGSHSVTMDWRKFLGASHARTADFLADTTEEAMDDLRRADKLMSEPSWLLGLWKSVVIHNEPLGPSGEYLTDRDKLIARRSALKFTRLCCDAIAMEWRI